MTRVRKPFYWAEKMNTKKRLVHGIGRNDATYPTSAAKGRKTVWRCPFYQAWLNMLKRAYSPAYHAKHPTYLECSVADQWASFSVFRVWMAAQNWQGNHLDKDLLVEGNKIYSPETCVFVSRQVNLFLNDREAMRGDWPIGVSWREDKQRFHAACNNPFTRKQEYLGLFATPEEAHLAWATKKLDYALSLAKEQTDPRVSAALISRFTAKYDEAVAALTHTR